MTRRTKALRASEARFRSIFEDSVLGIALPEDITEKWLDQQALFRAERLAEIIKWYIHRLRKEVEPDPAKPRYILNVRGVGYRFSG